MVRVNLLPREVIERRKYEQLYRYVFIGAVGMVLIVLFAYAGIMLLGQQKSDDLQALQEDSKQYQSQADAFGVFEAKEQELLAREQVAQTALAGRINMGMLAEEVSLVLPDEVWLGSMTISEKDGLTLAGNTPRSTSESVDIAYKSIAKLLVRLNELPTLFDVWLVTATNTDWASWVVTTGDPIPLPAKVVAFQAISKIEKPAAPATSTAGSAVPAPAATGK